VSWSPTTLSHINIPIAGHSRGVEVDGARVENWIMSVSWFGVGQEGITQVMVVASAQDE
jgi:hypothetical protein